jgi:hypothetical protein
MPSENVVIKFPQKINRLKLKVKAQNVDTENDAISFEPQRRNKEKRIFNEFFNNKCIQKQKFMTPYWRNIFPPRTSWLVFEKQMSKCNFNLLIFILKLHNRDIFENVNVESIKKKLIRYYETLIFNCKLPNHREREKRCLQILGRKWRDEGKGFIDLKNTPIDTIINDENYTLTIIDLMIYSYKTSIPIVVYYESKGSVKLTNFEKNNKNEYYYFVYYSSRTHDLYITIRNKSLKFKIDELGEKITKSLKEDSFKDFYSYLFNSNSITGS